MTYCSVFMVADKCCAATWLLGNGKGKVGFGLGVLETIIE